MLPWELPGNTSSFRPQDNTIVFTAIVKSGPLLWLNVSITLMLLYIRMYIRFSSIYDVNSPVVFIRWVVHYPSWSIKNERWWNYIVRHKVRDLLKRERTVGRLSSSILTCATWCFDAAFFFLIFRMKSSLDISRTCSVNSCEIPL